VFALFAHLPRLILSFQSPPVRAFFVPLNDFYFKQKENEKTVIHGKKQLCTAAQVRPLLFARS
jgi:hypothetical protein